MNFSKLFSPNDRSARNDVPRVSGLTMNIFNLVNMLRWQSEMKIPNTTWIIRWIIKYNFHSFDIRIVALDVLLKSNFVFIFFGTKMEWIFLLFDVVDVVFWQGVREEAGDWARWWAWDQIHHPNMKCSRINKIINYHIKVSNASSPHRTYFRFLCAVDDGNGTQT